MPPVHRLLIWNAAVAAALLLTSCGKPRDKTAHVYELGSHAETGHLIYTVFETQWLPQIGTGDTARIPKNRFFLVRLTVVNSGSEELSVPNITLQDDQGNVVQEMAEGDGVAQWLGYIRNVKPADSISGNVVFDAEPKHYRVRLSDENGEKPAQVDLPLNFTSETPQLPAPKGMNPNAATPAIPTPAR